MVFVSLNCGLQKEMKKNNSSWVSQSAVLQTSARHVMQLMSDVVAFKRIVNWSPQRSALIQENWQFKRTITMHHDCKASMWQYDKRKQWRWEWSRWSNLIGKFKKIRHWSQIILHQVGVCLQCILSVTAMHFVVTVLCQSFALSACQLQTAMVDWDFVCALHKQAWSQ